MLQIAVHSWDMSRVDFWLMVPSEFWSLYDGDFEKAEQERTTMPIGKSGLSIQDRKEMAAENAAMGIT